MSSRRPLVAACINRCLAASSAPERALTDPKTSSTSARASLSVRSFVPLSSTITRASLRDQFGFAQRGGLFKRT
jgi:hypothetical protein